MADQKIQPLSTKEQEYAIKTWRYLRLAIIILVSGLGVAVVYQTFHAPCKCFLTSISAYYYTAAHGYFVGALVSIGVCLFCLKGSTEWEDIFLNLAGLFAPIVALVPTPDEDHATAVLFTTRDIDVSVTNNITALLVAGAGGLLVAGGLSRRHRPKRPAWIGFAVAVLIWAVVLIWMAADRSSFVGHAHIPAAALMFSCIIVVVWLNALGYKRKKGKPSLKNGYLAIAIAMISSAAAMLIAKWAGWDYWLLVLEAALIGLFALFWVIQTIELWHEGLR